MIFYDIIQYDMIWFYLSWYDIIQYDNDMIWSDLLCCDMIWYDYDIISLILSPSLSLIFMFWNDRSKGSKTRPLASLQCDGAQHGQHSSIQYCSFIFFWSVPSYVTCHCATIQTNWKRFLQWGKYYHFDIYMNRWDSLIFDLFYFLFYPLFLCSFLNWFTEIHI